MKEDSIKKIGSIIIICIMMIMFILVCVRVISKKLYNIGIDNQVIMNLAKKNNNSNSNIQVKWKELYPFENSYTPKKEIETDIKEEIKLKMKKIKNKYISKINSLENRIEKNTSEDLIGYNKFLELSYVYDKIINYSLVSNNDVDARININGYLTRTYPYQDMTSKINKVNEFGKYLKERNINYAYILAPCKIEKNNNYVSEIYMNSANNNADKFIEGIKDNITFLDFRNIINVGNEEYLSLFFKYDHHWRPETGIFATYEISKFLNSNFEYNIDKELIGNMDNYNIEVYAESYLGSDGRYATFANSHLEDISVITPKFQTDLIVKIPEINPYKEGSFEDTLLDFDKLKCDNIYESDHYSVYGYGNKGLIEINNKNISDGKRLLIIKDSFANVVAPYLSLGIENTSIIDLRNFSGSVKTYINNFKPDTVIILYNVGLLNGNNNMFIFE